MEDEKKKAVSDPSAPPAIQFSLSDFASYDWEFVLSKAKKPVCSLYSTQLFQKSGELSISGDTRGAKLFRFLGSAASMMLRSDDGKSPFAPQFILQNGRSALLEDFTEEELDVCIGLVESTKDPAMRARLADMRWVAKRDHKAAKLAAEAYLTHFQRLDISEDWAWDIESLHRGVALAHILGRKNQLFQDYAAYIEKLLINHEGTIKGGPCLRIVDILLDYEIGNPASHGKIMDEMASRLDAENDYFLAQRHFEQAMRCHAAAKDDASTRASHLKKGKSLIRQAESAISSPASGYIAGSRFLALGIECLRQAHAPDAEIEVLHIKLRQWQQLSLRELSSFSHPVDLSKSVDFAIKLVRGKTLCEAIKLFALSHPPLRCEDLRKRVLENARDFPVSHLIAATFLSHDGRVMAHKPAVLGAGRDVDEKAVDSEMISQAKTVDLMLRVGGFVLPCRDEIWKQHRPTQRDLAFLVEDNPFIPPGHELLFLRGIQAGFEGDMIECSHVLLPQVEEAIRNVLRRAGHVTSKLDSKLIQEERLLGVLLALPETVAIFGEDTVFELRAILADPFGFDLRNRFAHGFLTTPECFGADVFLMWWWILRLCAFPVFGNR